MFDNIDLELIKWWLGSVAVASLLGLLSWVNRHPLANKFLFTFIGVFSLYFALYAGMRYFRPATWKAAGYK